MNKLTSKPLNPAVKASMMALANSIYEALMKGDIARAQAMINQIPVNRVAYVTMTLTVLASYEGRLHELSLMIEGSTR